MWNWIWFSLKSLWVVELLCKPPNLVKLKCLKDDILKFIAHLDILAEEYARPFTNEVISKFLIFNFIIILRDLKDLDRRVLNSLLRIPCCFLLWGWEGGQEEEGNKTFSDHHISKKHFKYQCLNHHIWIFLLKRKIKPHFFLVQILNNVKIHVLIALLMKKV